MKGIARRMSGCKYSYMPRKNTEQFGLLKNVGDGDDELRCHPLFSSFEVGVNLNNIQSLCD